MSDKDLQTASARHSWKSTGLPLVLAVALMAGMLVCGAFVYPRLTGEQRRASGASTIKGAWKIASSYADKHEGLYPPLDPRLGHLMFDPEVMYPDYCTNPAFVTVGCDTRAPAVARTASPTRQEVWGKELIDDHSFVYLGYAVTNNEEVLDLVEE